MPAHRNGPVSSNVRALRIFYNPMDSPKIPWPIELVKILIWPAFAFFVVIGFWEPLHSVARLMPDVLKETENITIGDVKISIRSTIATRVPIKVSPILPKLSPKTISSSA